MSKALSFAAAGAALLLVAGAATSASAVTYTMSSYSISSYQGNNGLDIETAHDENTPLTFNLNGNNATLGPIDLFDIWTDEDSVDNSDETQRPISLVQFTFSAPSPNGGTVTGETFGVDGQKINDGPRDLEWPPRAELRRRVPDDHAWQCNVQRWRRQQPPGCPSIVTSNDCLNPGQWNDADVTATFTQTINAGVPEPASWALMIGGFRDDGRHASPPSQFGRCHSLKASSEIWEKGRVLPGLFLRDRIRRSRRRRSCCPPRHEHRRS